MPRLANRLTDKVIASLHPRAKSYKVSDGKCLYLLVQPSGSKHWRMSFKFNGRESTLSGSIYPRVSISTARKWRAEMEELIDSGTNPNEPKLERRKEI